MARSVGTQLERSFAKGVITEASELGFPENSATDALNCVFSEKGRLTRRLGIDYEDDYTLVSIGSDLGDKVLAEYLWESVAGDGDLSFVVNQVGSTLYFFQATESGGLSGNSVATINLTEFSVAGAPSPDGVPCQFSAGNGLLFVVHPYLESFHVSWDVDSQTATPLAITIYIRDFQGVAETVDVSSRLTSITTDHKYNLYNQGWSTRAYNISGYVDSVFTYWDAVTSTYPSNADIWWLFKDSSDNFYPQIHANNKDLGNTPAPKGHYILKAFYQDRTAASGLSSIPVTSSGYFRPSTCVFSGSRLFYAGVSAEGFSNKIYMSPIIEDSSQYGKCYQVNDPTSEQTSDLLPTDGGVISILDIGSIIKLTAAQGHVIVFATNGVWTISGIEGSIIKANDYSIKRISNVASLSPTNFVEINGLPFWWNFDGIFTLTYDNVSQGFVVQSLTDQTIKTLYDNIPTNSKIYAKGAYNSKTRVAHWLYRSESTSDLAENFRYDSVLAFNAISNAFYPFRFGQPSETDGPFISGIVSVKGPSVETSTENVTDSGVTVTDGGVAVTTEVTEVVFLSSSFRYVTVVLDSGTYKLTFSQEKDTDYLDWASNGDDVDYDSYCYTSYKILGDGNKDFQSNYLTVFMAKETDASAFIQGWFNFSNAENSGQVSTPQQAYHTAIGNHSVSQRRLKIRGRGKSLQFKIYSEEGKPFTIIGWSVFVTGNTGV